MVINIYYSFEFPTSSSYVVDSSPAAGISEVSSQPEFRYTLIHFEVVLSPATLGQVVYSGFLVEPIRILGRLGLRE